jgi:hypothetical protein
MSSLTLNGIAVPVRAESFQESPREIGGTFTAFDGSGRKSRLALKRDCSFDTYAQTGANAYAWDMYIRGYGETFSFNTTVYGSKGTGTTSTTGTVAVSATTPKFGAGSLKLTAGTSATATYTFTNSTAWTVMFWVRAGAGSWIHYAVTGTGKKWVNGSRNDAASTSSVFTWTSGVLVLLGDSGSDIYFEDLVVMPFEVLTAWPPIFGVSSTAFSLLPRLTAAGDAVTEASTRSVLGDVGSHRVFYAYSGGSNVAHRELTVTLTEV